MRLSKGIEGFKIDALSKGYSPLTLAAYVSALTALVKLMQDPQVEDITESDLKAWMGYLRNQYKPVRSDNGLLSTASLHRYWKALRSFFRWAHEELGTARPDLVLQMPKYNHKEVIPFSEDDVQKLIKACELTSPARPANRAAYQTRRPSASRDKALVLVLLDTGVRAGECCRLRVDDVNLSTGEVQVRPYRFGKTRPRVVLIGKTARKLVWRYLQERGDDLSGSAPLFITDDGREMTRYTIGSLIARLGKRAGVTDCHPHRFRHTFAIQFLRNGGDVFSLQRLLGHATLEVVKHYLNLAKADDESAHRRASPADNWRL
ncbi:MAG TPA: tyrosine-type recombinase/integrase [Dissulfurispiraceae bacterium]|nr:tyrosine-type recombinase/integrase [Dissulfurispiraceae bacterium]